MAPGPEAGGAASGSLFQVSLGWGVLRRGSLETLLRSPSPHLRVSSPPPLPSSSCLLTLQNWTPLLSMN